MNVFFGRSGRIEVLLMFHRHVPLQIGALTAASVADPRQMVGTVACRGPDALGRRSICLVLAIFYRYLLFRLSINGDDVLSSTAEV